MKMNLGRKGIIALMIGAGALIAVVLYFLLRGTSEQRDQNYTAMLGNYVAQLQKEGLVNTGSIKLDVEQTPFILIFVPKTGEVTNSEAHGLAELILWAAQVFDERKGVRHQDINLAFQRPANQKIIFIKRTQGLPDLLAEHGEAMLQAIDPKVFLSMIDLAEPLQEGEERDFHSAWWTVQAVCLGFSLQQQQDVDADPMCNIVSANAAAAWIGMDRAEAESMLNEMGFTKLASVGKNDYKYRFIGFVYDAFTQK